MFSFLSHTGYFYISINSLADVKAAEGFIKVLSSNSEKRCQKQLPYFLNGNKVYYMEFLVLSISNTCLVPNILTYN